MDLYSILGVSASASGEEIERAYRRLVRRFHPGLNPGDSHAHDRYRQVEAAYRVLADHARRREYDERGVVASQPEPIEARLSFSGFDFSATADGPTAATFAELFSDVFHDAAQRAINSNRGLDVQTRLSLSFEEAVRGGRFQVGVARQERCAICSGTGMTERAPLPCPECDGQGTRRWARGHMIFTQDCARCGGQGRLARERCSACAGAGVQPRTDVVMIDVPPGIESGTRLVVAGRGHAAREGSPGDLHVTIDAADHPFFRRAGSDLMLTLPVAVHEAALGARVDAPTLDGPVKLRIPPGTTSGQRFRLRGRGVPSVNGPEHAGDLIIEVTIVLPPVRDERSRELLREFGRLNDVDVRQEMFEKLRSSH
jgi:molecular chaperone DnaJ